MMMYGLCEKPRSLTNMSPASFEAPPDACDVHMHVFGAGEVYPGVRDPQYLNPQGNLDHYNALAEHLGLSRAVLVQPSYYGTDNRCILRAMRASGPSSRAVVILDRGAPAGLLDGLTKMGVCGLRLDCFKAERDGSTPGELVQLLRSGAKQAASAGWHLELYAPGTVIRHLTPHLADLPVDVTINHLGYMAIDDPQTPEAFRRLVEQLSAGNIWIKLTAPYRIDKDRPEWSHAVDDMAKTLIAAAPRRMLWGTDWPHVPSGSRDTAAVFNRFASWCGDAETARLILVDNPAGLYGF